MEIARGPPVTGPIPRESPATFLETRATLLVMRQGILLIWSASSIIGSASPVPLRRSRKTGALAQEKQSCYEDVCGWLFFSSNFYVVLP
jgi:hypothetical protein